MPAYNEAASIEATLASIFGQSRPPDEVIVVDDCSTDGTGDIAHRCGAHVVRTPQNTGAKGQALNTGLQHATSDIVVTIDADTILAPDALSHIVEPLADPAVAAACGYMLPQRLDTTWQRGRYIEYMASLTFYKTIQSGMRALVVLSGCFTAFRRDVLVRLGGFKGRTIGEDLDMTWELHINGERMVYTPNAVCYPLDPGPVRQYYAQVKRWAHGFFQNIAVHRGALFRNRRLGLLIVASLLDIMTIPAYLVGAAIATFLWSWRALLILLAIEFATIFIPTAIGAWRIGQLKRAVLFFPFVWQTRILCLWIFWTAMIQVLVLGRKLHVWEKGH